MSKFRKWFFRFLTGYDLIDYSKLLKTASDIIDSSKAIQDTNERLISFSKAIINQNERLIKQIEEMETESCQISLPRGGRWVSDSEPG